MVVLVVVLVEVVVVVPAVVVVLDVLVVVVVIGLLQSVLNKSAVRSVQVRGIIGAPWQDPEYKGRLVVTAISSSTMSLFTSASHT